MFYVVDPDGETVGRSQGREFALQLAGDKSRVHGGPFRVTDGQPSFERTIALVRNGKTRWV